MPAAESSMFLPAEQEARLIAILRGAPPEGDPALLRQSALFAGVAGPIALALGDSESLAIQELSHQRNLFWLTKIAKVFDDSRIRFVILKGVPLSERYYTPTYLRSCGDLDVLIDPEVFRVAHKALLGLGYVPSQDVPADTTLLLGHDATYEHPVAPVLELHIRLHSHFGIRPETRPFLDRSVVQGLTNGCAVRVLCPEDDFVHLAAHAASHRWCQVRWLYDLVLLLRRQDVDWPTVVARVDELSLWPSVLLTCAVLETEWNVSVPLTHQVPSQFDKARKLLPACRYEEWQGSHWQKVRHVFRESAFCGGWRQKVRYLMNGFAYPVIRRMRERIR